MFSRAVRENVFTVMFLIGTGHMTESIRKEISTFKDILQVDVQDSYFNLVYKLLASYRWIAANHPDKHVLKIDSDVAVLLDEVESLLVDPSERLIQCSVNRYTMVERRVSHKWYIPESALPEFFLPNYCDGPMYLMTPAAMASILDVAWRAKVFEVEDVFFTGVLSRMAGVQLRSQRGMWHIWKPSQPCVQGKGTVIGFPVHSAGVEEMMTSWDHLRSIRCRWPIEHFLMSLILRD